MTDFVRIPGKIFAENASPVGNDPQIGKFGNAKQGIYTGEADVREIQNSEAWSQGWTEAVVSAMNYPPLPEMNGVLKVLSYQICYLLQKGIPQWNADTIYYTNDYVNYNGKLYYSSIDNNTFEPETPGAGNSWLSGTSDVAIATNTSNGISRPDGKTLAINIDGILSVNGLNNPYTLFDYKYSEYTLYNASWLLSAGQYNPASVYPTAYQALVIEQDSTKEVGQVYQLPNGTSYVKRGLPVVILSNEDIPLQETITATSGWTNYTNAFDDSLTTYAKCGTATDYITVSFNKPINITGFIMTGQYVSGQRRDCNMAIYSVIDGEEILLANGTGASKTSTYTSSAKFKSVSVTELRFKLINSSTNDPPSTSLPTRVCNIAILTEAESNNDYNFILNTENQTFRLPLISTNNKRILIDKKEPTEDNPTWYNLYSDGWLEQGGIIPTVKANTYTATTINLLKPYRDTSYTGHITQWDDNQQLGIDTATNGNSFHSKTTTSFVISAFSWTYGRHWTTQGYTDDTELIYSGLNTYFYIGETVQNANLIEAGKVLEVVNDININKMDKNALSFYPADKQIIYGGTFTTKTEFDLSDILPDGLVYCFIQAEISTNANGSGAISITSDLTPWDSLSNNYKWNLQTNNYFGAAGCSIIPTNNKKIYVQTFGVVGNCYVYLYGYQTANLGE